MNSDHSRQPQARKDEEHVSGGDSHEIDYVLGTHDEEVARLGLQHRVWRDAAMASWHRAGITHGSRVIDVGAGPGYATADLAEIVGPSGAVLGIERSRRFVQVARDRCERAGLTNAEIREADLMEISLAHLDYDASWCRWVASFVSSPQKLVESIAAGLRRGGRAVFHEYSDYETFCFMPLRPHLQRFIQEVMESWRAAGGEPNIGKELPRLLQDAGFRVLEIVPRVRTVSPRDYTWQWPASFTRINLARLEELGRITPEWSAAVLREFDEASADPGAWFTTPMFLEIIAQKE